MINIKKIGLDALRRKAGQVTDPEKRAVIEKAYKDLEAGTYELSGTDRKALKLPENQLYEVVWALYDVEVREIWRLKTKKGKVARMEALIVSLRDLFDYFKKQYPNANINHFDPVLIDEVRMNINLLQQD